jgi:hypothetical protein
MNEMSMKSQPVKRIVRPVLSRQEQSLEIVLPREAVQKRAYEIASKRLSYNDCVWLLAENDLRLGRALLNGTTYADGKVAIDPSKIVQKPDEKEIRSHATEIASKMKNLQSIHWSLAERQLVYDRVFGN